MRNIVIALAAVVVSASAAQAQFEDFLGSTGFSNFDGTSGSAGCLSGATGTGGQGGFGTTTCDASFTGEYSFNSFESVTGASFNQLTVGDLNTGSTSSQGIQSQWVMAPGEGTKSGGNTLSAINNNFNNFSGTQATEIAGGEFNSGTSTSFNGWTEVNTTSNFTIPMMNMGGMGTGGGD